MSFSLSLANFSGLPLPLSSWLGCASESFDVPFNLSFFSLTPEQPPFSFSYQTFFFPF